MSLATLGSKFWSPIHHPAATAPEAGSHPPQTAAERMAAGRALTRHAVLAALALGCVAYGLAIVLSLV